MFWFKILKKKEKIDIRKIRFNEIKNFLDEEIRDKRERLELRANNFRKNFIKLLNTLIENFDELNLLKFEKIILEDKRDISNIVETSRKNYCNTSKKLILNTINFLERNKDPLVIKDKILETFNKLNKFSREAQFLLIPFKNQMRNISANIKKVKTTIDDFNSFLASEYQLIEDEKKVLAIIEKIEINRKYREKKKSQIKEIENQIKNLKNKIKEKENEILRIKNFQELKRINKLAKEQVSLINQRDKIVSELSNLVVCIERQIKLYFHSSNLNKTEKSKVMDYIRTPEKLLSSETKLFREILETIGKKLSKIEKDERKRKKFLEIKRKIFENFDKFVSIYKELSEKILKINREIEKLKPKINISKEEQKLRNLNEKLEQLEKEKAEIEEELKVDDSSLFKELELILSELSGKKIKIL